MPRINNLPDYALQEEFIVARECDCELWFFGAYENAATAYRVADEIRGMVFQNLK